MECVCSLPILQAGWVWTLLFIMLLCSLPISHYYYYLFIIFFFFFFSFFFFFLLFFSFFSFFSGSLLHLFRVGGGKVFPSSKALLFSSCCVCVILYVMYLDNKETTVSFLLCL